MKTETIVGSGTTGKKIEVERLEDGLYRVAGSQKSVSVEVLENGIYSLLIDGASYEVAVHEEKKGYTVEVGPHRLSVRIADPLRGAAVAGRDAIEGEAAITSPMPGRIVGIKVEVGQDVKEGDSVILVEAMKMENELHAPKSGKVKKISVKMGEAVEAGQDLVVIE